jgi:hypothetical protein
VERSGELDGENVLVTLQFVNDLLRWVEISIATPGGPTWANWSATDEARKHTRHDEIVRNDEYGMDPYAAAWGQVGAATTTRAARAAVSSSDFTSASPRRA